MSILFVILGVLVVYILIDLILNKLKQKIKTTTAPNITSSRISATTARKNNNSSIPRNDSHRQHHTSRSDESCFIIHTNDSFHSSKSDCSSSYSSSSDSSSSDSSCSSSSD